MGPLKPEELTMMGAGAVVGKIPPGLPRFALPKPRLSDLVTMLPHAVIISLLGFMEAISIAKAMAAKTGQFLDPNQDLIGQGLANILGAFSQSFPTSGSFSRSAVNLQSGARTGLSSVVTSLSVVAVLLFFTPLLYYLPQATLAAVIMMAVVGLITPGSFVHAWKTHRVDGAISLLTFAATLIFAPHLDKGIMVGVGLSLSVFIYNSMKPRVAYLALHPDQSYRDAEHWGLAQCRHIAMIRYDGNLFFANASYFEDLIKSRAKSMPDLRHILLVANGINDMDASGEEVLSLIVDNMRSAGIEFSLSGVKENVLGLMKRTHLYEKIGEDHIFSTQTIAIKNIFDRAHRGSDESGCPLLTVRFRQEPEAQGQGDNNASH
jgi:anti-anti-sigma factor